MRIRTRRGLDIAVPGAPAQVIHDAPPVSSVAVLGEDHRLHRPRVAVSVGDRVRCGQPLVEDRGTPGVVLTSPASGVVAEVERGEGRRLRAVVISVDDGDDAVQESEPHPREELAALARETVVRTLLHAGLWPALRTRPFGRVPSPEASPHSIFVTATDTEPLAPRPDVVIAEHPRDFVDGLAVLARLTEGRVFLCRDRGRALPRGDDARIADVEVTGPHPAGLVGTHIHFLDPVLAEEKEVWHVGYQDVIAIGRVVTTGRPWVERVVALAGPVVERPRLLRTRLGAHVPDLVRDELRPGASRVISGSVLAGRQASGWGRHLGRFHRQVCVLPEPGTETIAQEPSTALRGRPGPMVPTEDFDRVVPLRLLPALLLRALLVGDDERALELGCLELDEEDLALCTYVCPGKQEYGSLLARTLERIEAGR